MAAGAALMEGLEARQLLSTITWDGGLDGNGTNLLDPVNWVGDVLPGPGDRASIGATGANPLLTVAGERALFGITSSRALRIDAGANLTMTSASSFGAPVIMNGGTLTGGAWTFSGVDNRVIATPLGGTLRNTAITGDLLLPVGSTLLIHGTTSFTTARLTGGGADLRLATGYMLSRPVTIEGADSGERTITLGVGNAGTNTITSSGSIRVLPGAGGGLNITRSATTTLVNSGLISVESTGRTLTVSVDVLTNNGTLQVSAGALTLSTPRLTNLSAGGSLSGGTWRALGGPITSSFGSITRIDSAPAAVVELGAAGAWSALDTLNVNAGTLRLLGGRDFATSGSFSNGATLELSAGSTLSVAGDFSQGQWSTLRSFISGPGLTTQVGRVEAARVATVSGVLQVNLVSGFTPTLGAVYEFIAGEAVTATPTISASGLPARTAWYPSATESSFGLEFDNALGVWTGAAGDSQWGTPGNWARGTLPTASIDAYISVVSNPTIVVAGAQVARSLFSNEALSITGTLRLDSLSTVNAPLSLTGTLVPYQRVTVTGALNWESGSISGFGPVIAAGAFSGPAIDTVLELRGNLEIHGAGILGAGSVLLSDATLTIAAGGSLVVSTPSGSPFVREQFMTATLRVSGTLLKAGPSTTTMSVTLSVGAGGIVDVQQGTLALAEHGNWTAGSSLRGAGTIDFRSGGHSFPAGSFSPSGPVLFNGGSAGVNNSWSPVGVLTISAGGLDQNVPLSLSSLRLSGGRFGGSGNITLTGQLEWTGGRIDGISRTVTVNDLVFNPGGSTALGLESFLEIAGTGSILSGMLYQLSPQIAVRVLSGAVLNVSTAAPIFMDESALSVAGTLIKNGPSSTTVGSVLTVQTGGIVRVDQGTLTFPRRVTYAAGSSLGGAGTINFQAGDHVLPAGSFSPSGTVLLSGARVTVNNQWSVVGTLSIASGTLTQNAPITVNALSISAAGVLSGSADVTIAGLMNWTGGSMDGPGRTVVSGAFVGSGSLSLSRTLEIAGTGTLSGAGIIMASGAVVSIPIGGTLTLSTTGNPFASFSGPNRVTVAGTLVKTGVASVTISTAFTLAAGGTLDVRQGTLTLSGAVSNISAGILTGGNWLVASGATLSTSASGFTSNDATIRLGGQWGALSSLSHNNGSLTLLDGNDLSVASNLNNTGTLDLSAGSELVAAGQFAQLASGRLRTEVASDTSFGRVRASGPALLDGVLEVNWRPGYRPTDATPFNFVQAAGATGTFSSLQIQSLGSNRRFDASNGPDGFTLTVFAVFADDQ